MATNDFELQFKHIYGQLKGIIIMKIIFLITIIFYSGYTVHSQGILTISDFFKNENGEIKISKAKQKKIKPILGSYYYCALDNCLHEEGCNVLKSVELLILELQNVERKFKKDYESISILEKRNKDSLSRMNISFDTTEFRKDFQKIQNRLEKFEHKVYSKNKISIYVRQNTFDKTDLKKFIFDIEELKKESQHISELEEKISITFTNWLNILNPLEKIRKLTVDEIWFAFVKSQMKQKWDEEILLKREKERKERLIKEGKENEEKEKQEQIEEEKEKFAAWKKNTRFSISYKVEIVNNIIKCSYCSYKKNKKNKLNFPNLNLSNYGNEKYMRKLWDEHKKIIEYEIIGNSGFFGHEVFEAPIFGGGKCDKCGSSTVRDPKSTFEKKIFKN